MRHLLRFVQRFTRPADSPPRERHAIRRARSRLALLAATALTLLAALGTIAGATAMAQDPSARPVVTGSAHVDFDGDGWRTVSLHAVEQDGAVDGRLELKNRASGASVRADLDCAAFGRDDFLILSGPVRVSNDPAFHACLESHPSERCLGAIAVQDNGQGRHAQPDQVTFFIPFYGFDEAIGGPLCEFLTFGPPDIFRLEATAGNIQVHVEPGDL